MDNYTDVTTTPSGLTSCRTPHVGLTRISGPLPDTTNPAGIRRRANEYGGAEASTWQETHQTLVPIGTAVSGGDLQRTVPCS